MENTATKPEVYFGYTLHLHDAGDREKRHYVIETPAGQHIKLLDDEVRGWIRTRDQARAFVKRLKEIPASTATAGTDALRAVRALEEPATPATVTKPDALPRAKRVTWTGEPKVTRAPVAEVFFRYAGWWASGIPVTGVTPETEGVITVRVLKAEHSPSLIGECHTVMLKDCIRREQAQEMIDTARARRKNRPKQRKSDRHPRTSRR